MPKGYTSSNTSVHFINYHFVWCPKYRRKVIVSDVESRLQEIIRDMGMQMKALNILFPRQGIIAFVLCRDRGLNPRPPDFSV